jgi:Tol biopolymer transport system component
VFIADLPEDLTQTGEPPLAGTATARPNPPRGVRQRRLTFTAERKLPGLQGPRHWLRCSPDGSRIAFLMKDDVGIVQLWTISPNDGSPTQLTHNPWPIASAFTWSPDGRHLTHVMDNSVFLTDATTGHSQRLTERTPDESAPLAEACVFSPDGKQIAFMRRVETNGRRFSQICVASLTDSRK